MHLIRTLGIAAALLAAATTVNAATLGLTATGIVSSNDVRDYTTGWAFRTTGPITVTGLGYYDAGGDGLADAHEVGLFTAGGTLLVSTIVPNGLAGTLIGDWRFQPITPYLLPAGSYVIGGLSVASVDAITVEGTPTGGPGVVVTDGRLFQFGSVLTFPDQIGAVYLNPNFTYEDAAVIPLPAAGWLVLSGLGVLGAFGRRKAA